MMRYETVNLLSKLAGNGTTPHALLFTGAALDDKEEVALKFSNWLFHPRGESFSDFYSKECICDLCGQIAEGIHPDLLILNGSSMQISEVRSLKNKFSSSAIFSGKNIAIIKNVHSMRIDAANSLLKILEEPPGDALFMLPAPVRSGILSTIASRAFEIRFPISPADLSERYKKNITKNNIKAIEIFEEGSLSEKFALAKKYDLENRPELIELINVWLVRMRDNILHDHDKSKAAYMNKILKVKKIITTTNANPQLVLEEALII